ncbi:hypothetical protein, partial [Bradyrhizobium sp.]|uniref:hypothetical protein n=1 Tax=Bradyrhizobium sp. TaxID=376 RepID=UPI00391A60E8
MNAKPRQIADCAADTVIERSLADNQVKAGFDLPIAKWKAAAVAGAVSAYDDVSPHAPSASASPMI